MDDDGIKDTEGLLASRRVGAFSMISFMNRHSNHHLFLNISRTPSFPLSPSLPWSPPTSCPPTTTASTQTALGQLAEQPVPPPSPLVRLCGQGHPHLCQCSGQGASGTAAVAACAAASNLNLATLPPAERHQGSTTQRRSRLRSGAAPTTG